MTVKEMLVLQKEINRRNEQRIAEWKDGWDMKAVYEVTGKQDGQDVVARYTLDCYPGTVSLICANKAQWGWTDISLKMVKEVG